MASCCYGGVLPLEVDKTNVNCNEDAMGMGEYPFRVPKVYLEGCGESYFPQYCFDWADDSVVLVRGKHMVEYTLSNFQELLAEDEVGDIVWMDGRSAPYSGCWGGEYLGEIRSAQEYTITEYNMDTLEKRQYKVTLDNISKIGTRDLNRVASFMDEAKSVSHFEIDDGVLNCYIGNEKELVIPNDGSIRKISANAFQDCADFHSIVIPDAVIEIEQDAFRNCFYLEEVSMPNALADRAEDIFNRKMVKEGDIWKVARAESFNGFCF